jgi:hypothetical protein
VTNLALTGWGCYIIPTNLPMDLQNDGPRVRRKMISNTTLSKYSHIYTYIFFELYIYTYIDFETLLTNNI